MTSNRDFEKSTDSYTTPLAAEHAKRKLRRVKRRKAPTSKAVRITVSALVLLAVFLLAFFIGSGISRLLFSPPSEKEVSDPIESASNATLNNKLNKLQEDYNALNDKYTELDSKYTELNARNEYLEDRLKEYEKAFGDLEEVIPSDSSDVNTSTDTTEQTPEAFVSESEPPTESSVEEL